jgi:hypothetical protein
MPENQIERYLTDMGEVRGTRSNVAETSFYPALERLLSDIGKNLSPKVRCVINLANRGRGLPDGGLFSADQFRRKTRDADAKENPFLVQNPSRGVTMPGKGKLIRREDGACDIFLNDDAFWRNVPETVWEYTIGGYQVIKKWLSYREKPLLGRGLTPDEVRYVTETARRLMALIALQLCLDDNYRNVIRMTYAWRNP